MSSAGANHCIFRFDHKRVVRIHREYAGEMGRAEIYKRAGGRMTNGLRPARALRDDMYQTSKGTTQPISNAQGVTRRGPVAR